MDYIGGMLNPIGKIPKTHYKREFCNGFTGNIGIYVGSIGLLLFFLAGLF